MDAFIVATLAARLTQIFQDFSDVISRELKEEDVTVPKRARMVCIGTKLSRRFSPHKLLQHQGVDANRIPRASISSWSAVVVDLETQSLWKWKLKVSEDMKNGLSISSIEIPDLEEYDEIHLVGLSSKSTLKMFETGE